MQSIFSGTSKVKHARIKAEVQAISSVDCLLVSTAVSLLPHIPFCILFNNEGSSETTQRVMPYQTSKRSNFFTISEESQGFKSGAIPLYHSLMTSPSADLS